jgi:hypothetical protein
MNRITHQSPRQRGYGSTSSPRNDSLKHTQKHKKGKEGIEPRSKAHRLWRTVWPGGADRPHWPRGPSGLLPRTVRPNTADCPALCHRPSDKAHRTTRSEPRKTDRPRGARGLSAKHPRTVRPLLRTVRNHFQPKHKIKTDRKRNRARKREEHCSRGPSTRPSRTVRQERIELKKARPRKSTPPNHHRISQTVEAVETRVWGLENRHTRMV